MNVAENSMDIGFLAFPTLLDIYIMFGWKTQRSDSGGSRMRTHSPVFVRKPEETLVDAFIASDLALTGTMKSFIRNDMDHPWTGAGFLFMALYRPSERGTGNDITISVDPSSRITLKELHHGIEMLECERWIARGKHRPYDHPREGFEWNQPWYLEQRNESLIGAPRWLVKGQQLGSELDRQDILDLLWKLYNPARTLQVMPYGIGSTSGEKDCRAIDLCNDLCKPTKPMASAFWQPADALRNKAHRSRFYKLSLYPER